MLLEVLGEEVLSLPENLLLAHSAPLRARGNFLIESPPSRLVKLAVAFWSLPKPGPSVDTMVRVEPTARGQRWSRSFGSQQVVTEQWVENGCLVEGRGQAMIRMRLSIIENSILYETIGVRLGLIPLPKQWFPSVTAKVVSTKEGWHVSVEVKQRPFGILCKYSGNMKPE